MSFPVMTSPPPDFLSSRSCNVFSPLEFCLPLALSRRCSRNELQCTRVGVAKCATLTLLPLR
ncbi:BnaC05g09260D [Brassica napus]|uniref:BnaC05g09260D protein n=1 Tax=Brassica napus TaxID=3708 RepID=A0A078G320_BRANA|nr:BnaC05g09260D [Brassica napus]